MGRPLKGSLRYHQGRWWASVPAAKGGSRRREEGFSSEGDARAWLAQAVAALEGRASHPRAGAFPHPQASPAPGAGPA